MMEQRTEDYRDVLEDLARSRGMSGAEELARRVVEVDPDYTVRGILEGDVGGFGPALDKVIATTEEEKVRISWALGNGPKAKRALGLCPVPGCERPGQPDTFGCELHRRLYNAQADREAWQLAVEILDPWVESARRIAHDELTWVMEEALEKAKGEVSCAQNERKEAEAALESA